MTIRHDTPWPGLLILLLLGGLIGFLTARVGIERPLIQQAVGTEYSFVAAARNLDSPQMVEPPVSTTAPAYPHLLARLGDLTTGIKGARQVQWTLLGGLLPFLAGLAAARHFGARTGLVAGGLALVTGGFWVSAGTLVPYAWQTVGALLLLVLAPPFGRPMETYSVKLPAVIGMGVVLALTRLFGAAWAPAWVVLLAMVLIVRRQFKPGLAILAAFGLALALGGAARLDKMPGAMPLIGGGGVDALYGWHDGATGIDPRRGEGAPWRWTTAREIAIEAERTAGRGMSVAEFSRMNYARAAGWALSHPIPAVGLAFRKSWLVLSGVELAAPESASFRAAQTVPWAGWLLPISILIMTLGLAGVAGLSNRDGAARPESPTSNGPSGRPALDGLTVIKTLILATLLAAIGGVFRSGDRMALLGTLTGVAAWTLTHFRSLPWRPTLLVGAAAMIMGATAWTTEGRRLESTAEDNYQLGTALDRMKRSAEAGAAYDRALAADPRHVGAQLARAGRLAADGLYDGAISEAENIVAANPRLVTVWHMLARLYQTQNRWTEAVSAYERVVEETPRDPEAWNNLGTIHATLGHYEPAVAALKQALAIDPNFRNAYVNLTELEKRGPAGLAGATPSVQEPATGADALAAGVDDVMQKIQANDVAGAQAILSRLRESFGASPEIDMAAGTLALHVGRLDEAASLLERARSSPKLAMAAWYNLGVVRSRQGQSGAAISAFEEVLKLDPNNQPASRGIEQLKAAGGSQ